VTKEGYYRLLTGEQGEAVRQMTTSGKRIAGAIELISDSDLGKD
jgi:hypothetical protein